MQVYFPVHYKDDSDIDRFSNRQHLCCWKAMIIADIPNTL